MSRSRKKIRRGFSLIEIVLAIAIFATISTSMVGVVLQGLGLNRLSAEETIANQYASEGLEAVKSIKNQSYSLLADTATVGLSSSSGVWVFSGTSNSIDKYTRTISISPVQRDTSGNIVQSGGTADPSTKKITSTVNWTVSGSRQNSVLLSTYLTNWGAAIIPPAASKRGMLVYSTGGTSSDAYVYRTIDATTGVWNAPANMPDIDPNTTNRALRMVRVHASLASSTRREKVVISRHSDGTNQYIYAQVYNGDTGTFVGTPLLLSTITNNSSLFQQNFDGTYLANGDFMAIFTENSNTPKMRIWNGSVWSDSVSLRSIGGIPNWIVAKTRPGTNEVMVAFFSQNKNTHTEYFNGGAYTTASWALHSRHSADAPANYYHLVDFTWDSNDPTKGALIYPESATDRSITAKIWTADGAGAGNWSSAGNSANQETGRYVADMRVVSRPGTNQFMTCDEDNNPSSRIYCFNFDVTPTFNTPANNIIASLSDSGPQRAFDIAFPSLSGATGLSVFSDRTNIAKLKKFNAGSNSWDSSPTAAGTLSGLLKIVSLHNDPLSNDVMILLADANQNLYTEVWDGTTNQLYSTPTWKSFADQAAHGSANEEQWFDFAWDSN